MLRLTSTRRAVVAASHEAFITPTVITNASGCPTLYFADRAVKSTHASPVFLCTRYALVSGCERGSAAVAVHQVHAPGYSALPQRTRKGSPIRLMADIRVKGCSAVGVFRRGELRFLCQGDAITQHHAMNVHEQDVFVLLASLSPITRLEATVNALQDTLRLCGTDMEYVAEEALLTLSDSSAAEGSLCVVGRTASSSLSTVVPPLSSMPFEEL